MGKTFDKESWLKEKSEKLDAAKAALENGLKALDTSDDWKNLLRSMAHAGALSVMRYSFGNNLLIQLARPGTSYAATYKQWQGRGRQVRAGEKGTAIIRPIIKATRTDEVSDQADSSNDRRRGGIVGFGLVTVFALDQTEGDPIEKPQLPDVSCREAFDNSVARLREVALGVEGRPVTKIELRPRQNGDPESALGWYVPSTKEIVVVTGERPAAHEFKTLCHEIAHALLHPAGERHTRAEAEVEAESTAFVVCHALGLDTGSYSFPYVKTWAREEDVVEVISRTGDRIIKASRTILAALAPTVEHSAAEAA